MSQRSSRTYSKTAKALVGRQGTILVTTRDYDAPLPKRAPVAADVLGDAGVGVANLLSRATKMWKDEAKKGFRDFIALADLKPITGTGQDSTMVTLNYSGIDENRWLNLWTWKDHFKKHIDRLYKMGKGAWGDGFALMWHFEFETEFGQRPHFHVWLAPRDGRSSYISGSQYFWPKAGVQGLVFWRWLEAAWSLIIGVEPNLVKPQRTWMASEAEMQELYGQDSATPLRVSRYWLKEGNSPEMAAKRRQLVPPPAWVKRGMIFRYAGSYGLGMDYVEVTDLTPEAETAFREEVSRGIDPIVEICGETGEIRNISRLSPDATQGGRQYEVFDEDRRQALVLAASAS